jgi:hypothetical protein
MTEGKGEGNMDGVGTGRVVHYVLKSGKHRPAIIVEPCSAREQPPEIGVINIVVFLDGTNDMRSYHEGVGMESGIEFSSAQYSACTAWRTSVHFSAEPKPGTWHWPEKV